jgi:hypothetical protein
MLHRELGCDVSNVLSTIKLNYLHDLQIMFQCLLHLNMYMEVWLNPDFLSELKTSIYIPQKNQHHFLKEQEYLI